jgi:hypothetical protein
MKRPKREQLNGMSPSEFKTLLKRRGYNVGRDFFKFACIATYKNRSYRFRWYSTEGGFVVDKSCIYHEFDRWANSTDEVIAIADWLEGKE